jgi:hypothetical protein
MSLFLYAESALFVRLFPENTNWHDERFRDWPGF